MTIVIGLSSLILTLSLIIGQFPSRSKACITVKALAMAFAQGRFGTNPRLCRLVLSGPKYRHAGHHVQQLVNVIR